MCGIAGIISQDCATASLTERIDSILNQIRHRGPDDGGRYVVDGLAIGMRRLSIIDVANGHQPMFSEDGRVALVFNGEIYNFRQLRQSLEGKGHVFRTSSDTEVILKGYLEWGIDELLDQLDGMFAFAIVDHSTDSILIARDHFGIKPLYFYHQPGFLAFCSEPKPLLSLDEVSATLSIGGLSDFLTYKYIPGDRTFIEGISKLESGSYLALDLNCSRLNVVRYWELAKQTVDCNFEEALERGQELLEYAVRDQLVSEVPVGICLSSGIDSGLILSAVSGTELNKGSSYPAFTVGFDDESFDEVELAQETARHFGVEHIVSKLKNPSASQVQEFVELYGEPFANLSVPANFLLYNEVKKHATVALNGSGADELFAGYERYYAVNPPGMLSIARSLAAPLRFLANGIRWESGKKNYLGKLKRFLETSDCSTEEGHQRSVSLFLEKEFNQLRKDKRLLYSDHLLDLFRDATKKSCTPLQAASWSDMRSMMPEDYLTLVDRTSMAASVEVRVPYLSRQFAEFAWSLPDEFKMRGWKRKYILREMARRKLPARVVAAPKQGFESPVANWFRNELRDAFLPGIEETVLKDLLNMDFVKSLLNSHTVGGEDSSKQLLALYTLSLWLKSNHIGL